MGLFTSILGGGIALLNLAWILVQIAFYVLGILCFIKYLKSNR